MPWADNDTPADWIASWSEDGTNVTFPIASVPEMTAAEADATTGDARKVIYALAKKFYDKYAALAAADRPAQMTITKSEQANTSAATMTVSYVFQFVTTYTGQEVAAES